MRWHYSLRYRDLDPIKSLQPEILRMKFCTHHDVKTVGNLLGSLPEPRRSRAIYLLRYYLTIDPQSDLKLQSSPILKTLSKVKV